jgi:predicted CoA-substrate-specific enzyme activase
MAGLYAGIDLGSCTTKAVVIDQEGTFIGTHVCRSGVDYQKVAREVLSIALGGWEWDGIPIVSTGYGRHNVGFAAEAKTEISCHARGGYAYALKALTLVDIGGQDNKVIKLDADGRRLDFRMNRKCAAGTGTFIEQIAAKMDVPLHELDGMARKAQKPAKIGSYCTVFAYTEILERIRAGAKPEELLLGTFESVADRVMEMFPLDGTVLLCGGVVEYFPIVVEIFKKRVTGDVIVPPHPQLTGAYGAALFARELAG